MAPNSGRASATSLNRNIVGAAGMTERGDAADTFSTPTGAVVVLAIAVVLVTELMNTAIEKLVDLVTRERSPAAGKIKDIAAAASLLACIASAVVGSIVFGKYVLHMG